MNPAAHQMNLTQDMNKLTRDLVQISGNQASGAGYINYQNNSDPPHDKIFIKKNLNARTMRNTLQVGSYNQGFNTQSNVTPTAIVAEDDNEDYAINNRTQTQPRNNVLGLTPNKFDSSDVHHMSLMTPNNMSLMSPNNQAGSNQDMTMTSNIDTAANTLTPYGREKM